MHAFGGAGSGLGGGDLGGVSWLELFFMVLPPGGWTGDVLDFK